MTTHNMSGPAIVWRAPTFYYDMVRRKSGAVVIERAEGHNIYVTICSRKPASEILFSGEHHAV